MEGESCHWLLPPSLAGVSTYGDQISAVFRVTEAIINVLGL